MTGTAQEIDFINHLGTYTENGRRTAKKEWLLMYLQLMERRRNWDNINKLRVLMHVKKLLNQLEGEQA